MGTVTIGLVALKILMGVIASILLPIKKRIKITEHYIYTYETVKR